MASDLSEKIRAINNGEAQSTGYRPVEAEELPEDNDFVYHDEKTEEEDKELLSEPNVKSKVTFALSLPKTVWFSMYVLYFLLVAFLVKMLFFS